MFLNLHKIIQNRLAAIDSNGDRITYGELITFSEEWRSCIPDRCLVLVLGDNSVGGLVGYIGSLINKIVPLIVSKSIKKDSFNSIKTIYCPEYIWMPEECYDNDGEIIIKKYGYVLIRYSEGKYPLHDQLSLLLTTSGSTGSPKLVRHSYENLEVQAKNISDFFEIKEGDRPLVSLPIQYTMTISTINSYLYMGATLILSNESLLSSKLWKMMRDERVSSFTGVPYSFELMNKLRIYTQKFPDLKLLTQGGGKLDGELQIKFAEYIEANDGKYIATYGQTEGSARMAYLPAEYAKVKCGSIGRAIPNGQLFLIDDNGNSINRPNQNGEMVFKGKNVTLGYAECGGDLIKGDENKGILYTGDIAYKDEDGFFYIVGRKKRFLKLYGHRVSLDECEQLIKSKFQIECACCGSDSYLHLYITDSSYIDKVFTYILEKTELYSNSVKVNVIKQIPKNEAGKVLYSAL